MKRKTLVLMLILVAAAALAACGVNSTTVSHVPRANVLQVPYVEQAGLDPAHGSWNAAIPLNVPLTGMDIKGEWPIALTPTVQVTALRDQDKLYFRLSWADATQDDIWADADSFMDAAAVQLPIKSGSEPYICMGQENELVNILYWRAGQKQGENLLGGGYSTLTATGEADLPLNAVYDQGTWTVIIARPLAEQEKGVLTGQQITAAFAVWNGADQQRGGRKSTSQWITLSFEQPGA